MSTATKKAAGSKIAPASREKATKANDDTTPRVKAFDLNNLPKGITVSQVGTFAAPEFLVSHDGINDDGTVSAGWACRTTQVDDIAAIVKHRGVIPE